MKKLILFLIAMIFIAGCNAVNVKIRDWYSGKVIEEVSISSAMVTQDVNGLIVKTPNILIGVDTVSMI